MTSRELSPEVSKRTQVMEVVTSHFLGFQYDNNEVQCFGELSNLKYEQGTSVK
jgi:hypothetical protein